MSTREYSSFFTSKDFVETQQWVVLVAQCATEPTHIAGWIWIAILQRLKDASPETS